MIAVLAFVAIFVFGLACLSLRNIAIAIRLGRFTNRNGIEINRREDTVLFWFYMLMGVFPLAICLCVGGWVAYEVLRSSHG